MFKRVIAVLLSLPILMIPSHAWSYQSFIGKENFPVVQNEYYGFESPVMFAALQDDVAAMAASESAELTSVSGADFMRLFSADASTAAVGTISSFYVPKQTVAGISIGGYSVDLISPVPFVDYFFNYQFGKSIGSRIYFERTFTVPAEQSGNELRTIRSLVFGPSGFSGPGSEASSEVFFNVDLSSFGSFSSFELDGLLRLDAYIYSGTFLSRVWGGPFTLYVNDICVKTFYSDSDGYIDFADFIYDASEPITSIQFRFNPLPFNYSCTDDLNAVFGFSLSFQDDTKFSVLSGQLGKPSGMDYADSALNEYQQQEGQYFQDAHTHIDNLDPTIPEHLYNAAELLGGLFNDLWNTLGGVTFLYYTPILFGFFFWLAGRMRR